MRAFALMLVIGVLLPVVGWAEVGLPLPPPPPPRAPTARPPVVEPQGPAHAQPSPARAPDTKPPEIPAAATTAPPASTAKIPRFESLRSNEVNLRAGPGTRYRIDWVYKRIDLPVEIEREFEHWRAIRDADGTLGWVNQATLTMRRHFIVQGQEAMLRDDANDTSAVVAILKPGVIGRIRSCKKGSEWCKVDVAGHGGYLRRAQFWGTLPDEEYPAP